MAAGATAIRRRTAARKKRAKQSSATTAESPYLNRDETWLEFNRRVLEEADDASNPLLERVKFLAITASNLDEFLEIRVAGLLQQIEEDIGSFQMVDDTGLTLQQRLDRLGSHLHDF
ncbi:MAG TPA: RNA degradosome polyphosphate kinase, partial [Acidobacteriaceae bacterium]